MKSPQLGSLWCLPQEAQNSKDLALQTDSLPLIGRFSICDRVFGSKYYPHSTHILRIRKHMDSQSKLHVIFIIIDQGLELWQCLYVGNCLRNIDMVDACCDRLE